MEHELLLGVGAESNMSREGCVFRLVSFLLHYKIPNVKTDNNIDNIADTSEKV